MEMLSIGSSWRCDVCKTSQHENPRLRFDYDMCKTCNPGGGCGMALRELKGTVRQLFAHGDKEVLVAAMKDRECGAGCGMTGVWQPGDRMQGLGFEGRGAEEDGANQCSGPNPRQWWNDLNWCCKCVKSKSPGWDFDGLACDACKNREVVLCVRACLCACVTVRVCLCIALLGCTLLVFHARTTWVDSDDMGQILAGKARFETASPEEHSKCAKCMQTFASRNQLFKHVATCCTIEPRKAALLTPGVYM